MHALRSSALRRLLDSSVFEPGKHLEPALDGHIPSTVPAEEPKALATPYGALLNEVHRAPATLCEAARQLLALAIDMDTGLFCSCFEFCCAFAVSMFLSICADV